MGTISINVQRTRFYFHTNVNWELVKGSTTGLCVLCFFQPVVQEQEVARGSVAVPTATCLFTFQAVLSYLLEYLVAHLERNYVLLLWRLRLGANTTPCPSEGEPRMWHLARVWPWERSRPGAVSAKGCVREKGDCFGGTCAGVWAKLCVAEEQLCAFGVRSCLRNTGWAQCKKRIIDNQTAVTLHIFWASVSPCIKPVSPVCFLLL